MAAKTLMDENTCNQSWENLENMRLFVKWDRDPSGSLCSLVASVWCPAFHTIHSGLADPYERVATQGWTKRKLRQASFVTNHNRVDFSMKRWWFGFEKGCKGKLSKKGRCVQSEITPPMFSPTFTCQQTLTKIQRCLAKLPWRGRQGF